MSTIAIVHPMTLLGKELRETLDRLQDVRLLSNREDEIGTLTEVAGAAAMVTRYEPEKLQGASIAFLCGTMEDNRPILAECRSRNRPLRVSAVGRSAASQKLATSAGASKSL